MNATRLSLKMLLTKSTNVLFLFLFFMSLALANEHPVSQVIIPKTIPEIFQEIDEYNVALYNMLENNQLNEVHYHVFALVELVNALPNLSQNVSPAQFKILQNNIAAIKKLATQMDESSDANDYKATQTYFKELRSILDKLHAYYAIKKHTQ
ncbi:hypothetical protein [Legionella quateirensis]|uniref:Chemiosmotic efflux system C protein A n=1 Tax=Legionella quateirensis TaxID=45072 RepID=A0A378P8M5_9GAMM|nr:hypothetical protein [Legionella quateirensis]KTD44158.1 chemiosmotic efflux system C protein A [Legionella quateirensis]STY82945.1 Chemiosmotic efflux system C protein A [Legionella quateirensis]